MARRLGDVVLSIEAANGSADVRRLYQRVADELREKIRTGAYEVGQRLPAERLLAEEFSVSRPTVREAVIALEIGGFVEVRTGSGVYVTSRTGDARAPVEAGVGPFELLEARRVIESDIAAMAAARIEDAQLARLEALLEQIAHENELEDSHEEADRDFHLTIAEGTQNSAMRAVVRQMWSIRETSPMLVTMLGRARSYGVRPLIEDHRAILDALSARDPDGARVAMHAHLTRVIDALLEATEAEALERARKEAASLRDRYQPS